METIFISQYLWDVVEKEYVERLTKKKASWTEEKEREYKQNVKKMLQH